LGVKNKIQTHSLVTLQGVQDTQEHVTSRLDTNDIGVATPNHVAVLLTVGLKIKYKHTIHTAYTYKPGVQNAGHPGL
jgi:hypothetical protein